MNRLPVVMATLVVGSFACSGDENDNAVPAAPSQVIATATWSTTIMLTWTDNSTNETGFEIERISPPSTGFARVGTRGPDQTAFGDFGLVPSTTYYYRVRATGAASPSDYSNVASATTLAPLTAESLGQLCTDVSQCPFGYRCVAVQGVGSQTDGFCTIPCGGVDDTTTCSNDFPGPGSPACLLPMPAETDCVILCDTPNEAGQCPTGLTCTFVPSDNLSVCVQP